MKTAKEVGMALKKNQSNPNLIVRAEVTLILLIICCFSAVKMSKMGQSMRNMKSTVQ